MSREGSHWAIHPAHVAWCRLSDGRASERHLIAPARRTPVNRDHGGGDEAHGMIGYGPDHFLTLFAANHVGLAIVLSHGKSLGESLVQLGKRVKARAGLGGQPVTTGLRDVQVRPPSLVVRS